MRGPLLGRWLVSFLLVEMAAQLRVKARKCSFILLSELIDEFQFKRRLVDHFPTWHAVSDLLWNHCRPEDVG